MGAELIGDVGACRGIGQHGAAADVKLGVEDESHRIAGLRLVLIAVEGRDARDPDAPAGSRNNDVVAGTNPTRGYRAG
jgi:hypothetical protein